MKKLNKPEDEKYAIEKGVPMPLRRGQSMKKADGFVFKNVPSKEMEVGDSFAVPITNEEHINYVQGIIKTRVRLYGLRCEPTKVFETKFNSFLMELRVWRTA